VIDEIRGLLDQYAQWVRDKSVLREVNDQYVEITTPYLDRHNDYTQIYVRRDNGAFLLTDGGETIQDLRASGCDLETSKRKDLLTSTLNGFGIRRDGDALLVTQRRRTFSPKTQSRPGNSGGQRSVLPFGSCPRQPLPRGRHSLVGAP
jgi:hypothetical protein